MLRTKKKTKKKTIKKTSSTNVKKESIPEAQLPKRVPGEKLLAALQEWKYVLQAQPVSRTITEMESNNTEQDSKELRLVFKCVDVHKTGFLNASEVQSALELMGFVINEHGEERIKKWMDLNKGSLGFCGFQELIADWHGVTRDFYKELKKGFSMIDHDKDGKITISDLSAASKMAGIHLSRQELEEMMAEADQNGDHAIDISEFIEIMLKTNLF
ncbi:caltractin [Xenopus laevis]|uniref:Caltractin n=1 Tax=Xenopus laevis TaxID=8355 RepID=A0A8J1LBW8_XENLA|nr:caltractin [Xenopus laevis]